MKKIERGISKYFDDEKKEGESSDDFSEGEDEVFKNEGDKGLMAEQDPSKLIDIELVNLLRFCNDLKEKYKENEDYQFEIMDKGFELGKTTKDKTLILDMDETLIAAKFEGKEPKNFQRNFSFKFGDSSIHVRYRPYLQEALEKLA